MKIRTENLQKTTFTYRSRRASFFKSEKSGIEFLNSFIFSSRTWHSGKALTSRGSLLSCLMKPSIPSDNTDTSRLAHSVLAHSSRAACQISSKSNLLLLDIIVWQGKSERSDWSFLTRDFALRTVSVETVISCVFFAFESRQIQNKRGPSAI